MNNPEVKPTLAQTFDPVKSLNPSATVSSSNDVIHHKDLTNNRSRIYVIYKEKRFLPYGVSPAYRVLSPQLLLKKWNYVVGCLGGPLGLTTAQREVVLRLLTLWAYYGKVYPKESQITEDPGCSKATFWRTVRLLKELGLIDVLNRYVIREHAQISNLYSLDRLVMVIARYLAEHGTRFYHKWLEPLLRAPAQSFWSLGWLTQYKFLNHTLDTGTALNIESNLSRAAIQF